MTGISWFLVCMIFNLCWGDHSQENDDCMAREAEIYVKWGDFGLPGDFGQTVAHRKKALIKQEV